MKWRGRSALCCEKRMELARERDWAMVSGVSLPADIDCAWEGLQGTCPPLTYVCLDPI